MSNPLDLLPTVDRLTLVYSQPAPQKAKAVSVAEMLSLARATQPDQKGTKKSPSPLFLSVSPTADREALAKDVTGFLGQLDSKTVSEITISHGNGSVIEALQAMAEAVRLARQVEKAGFSTRIEIVKDLASKEFRLTPSATSGSRGERS